MLQLTVVPHWLLSFVQQLWLVPAHEKGGLSNWGGESSLGQLPSAFHMDALLWSLTGGSKARRLFSREPGFWYGSWGSLLTADKHWGWVDCHLWLDQPMIGEQRRYSFKMSWSKMGLCATSTRLNKNVVFYSKPISNLPTHAIIKIHIYFGQNGMNTALQSSWRLK